MPTSSSARARYAR
uniref:Uncharacterized protein n=1 Tax=Arundo donax TaxID=35708 RepID=A0A0A9BSE4_ARUDO